MKRRLLALVFFLACTLITRAQEHIFVLVDVSGSRGMDPIKTEAKDQVYNLLMGQYTANGWNPVTITDKKVSDIISSASKQPLIGNNSWICIVPFGNKDTYKRYSITQSKNYPLDFQNLFLQHYPASFKDGYTYIQIAEAFTASLAKTYNINEYYMFIVTDGLGDHDDTDSKHTYDPFEESLLLEWNNTSSSIVKNVGTLTKSKYYINLRKVTNVKGTQFPVTPGVVPPAIVDSSSAIPKIVISSPPEGKKNKEAVIKTETLNVNWACQNCPQGIKFNVMVSGYGGNKSRETKKELSANTATFKLPDGKYRVTVSSPNYPAAASDTTFIEVSTGSYGGLLAALLLAALAGGAYMFWNKKRKRIPGKKADDIFSTGNSTAPQSNSKHY